MTLEETINADIKAAMLARDAKKLEALRAVKAALLLEKTKEGATGDIQAADELKILRKLVKQRKDSAEIYTNAGRADLAEKELFDASVIETYLPAGISESELLEILRRVISETGATSMKDMGRVMAGAARELAGRADNAAISSAVKQLLGT